MGKGAVRGEFEGVTEIEPIGDHQDKSEITEIIMINMVTDLPKNVMLRMTLKYHTQFVKLRSEIEKTANFFNH